MFSQKGSILLLIGLICYLIGACLPTFAEEEEIVPKAAEEKILAEAKKVRLTEKAQEKLLRNGFVVVPEDKYKDIYELYKNCKEKNIPIFVTTDSILHTSHILFDYALRILEIEKLYEAAILLTEELFKASIEQYEKFDDEKLKEAARLNVAFFGVARKLLDSEADIPDYVKKEVEADLVFIENHKGFEFSYTLDNKEDFSQYVPRGHYTRNDKFKRYFKMMMWYGRRMFRVDEKDPFGAGSPPDHPPIESGWLNKEVYPPEGIAETRRALLILGILKGTQVKGEMAIDVWGRLYDPITLFVGESDDLNVNDYLEIAKEIYGGVPSAEDLVADDKIVQFAKSAADKRAPKIDSTGMGRKGFSLLGQRFTPDAYILQNLVYHDGSLLYTGRDVAPFPFTYVMTMGGPIRGFPRGLDVMAVLGSDPAYDILKDLGDTQYSDYEKELAALKQEFGSDEVDIWGRTLYYSWISCLRPLLDKNGDEYPAFMRTRAWRVKELTTALASWAELRHDTILYAKQSYTGMLRAISLPPQMTKGYVAPNPTFCERVADMMKQMREGLKERGILPEELEDKMAQLEDLATTFKVISDKELKGKSLTEEEYRRIWEIGDELESIISFSDEIKAKVSSEADTRMAIIADVHTENNTKQVLEEGVGDPFSLYAVVEIEGGYQLLKGAIFSYYEFKHPMKDRLTDEKWQKMLEEEKAPELPEWTTIYMENGE